MPNFVVLDCVYSFKVSVVTLSLSQRLIVVFLFRLYIWSIVVCLGNGAIHDNRR